MSKKISLMVGLGVLGACLLALACVIAGVAIYFPLGKPGLGMPATGIAGTPGPGQTPVATTTPTVGATTAPQPTPTATQPATAPTEIAAGGTATPTVAPPPTATPTPTLSPLREICNRGHDVVVLLLDPSLENGIRSALDQFEIDLCNDGYTVIERISDFLSSPDLRTYLAGLYTETGQNLVGAILIGDIPYAYQQVTMTFTKPDIPPSEEEVISFQYYADLDGIFDRSPGYVSPGGHSHSYDIHSGEVDWEIWMGVLPLYKGDYDITVEAMNRYFQKNHAYRTGGYKTPRAFLQISEHFAASTIAEHNQILENLSTGQYSWTPFSNSPNAHIYFDSSPGGLSVARGYASMSAGVADFTVGDAHGYWGAHGQIDITWAESNPVKTVFFWSNGCAVGNLDYAENFLTSVLYSPTSMVLVAKGTTNDSGGMGTNENGFFGHNIATALSQGESFGQAILSHVNVPLIWPWSDNREFHFATVEILGDPTLGLQP